MYRLRQQLIRACWKTGFVATLGAVGVGVIAASNRVPAQAASAPRELSVVPVHAVVYMDEHERQRKTLGGPEKGSALAPSVEPEKAKQTPKQKPRTATEKPKTAEAERVSIGEMVDTVKKKAYELGEDLTSKAEGVREAVKGKAGMAKRAAEETVEKVEEEAGAAVSKVTEKGRELKKGVQEKAEEAREAVEGLGSEAARKARDAEVAAKGMMREAKGAKQTTSSVMGDLAEGVMSGMHVFKEKGKDMLESAKQATKYGVEKVLDANPLYSKEDQKRHVVEDKERDELAERDRRERAALAAAGVYEEEDTGEFGAETESPSTVQDIPGRKLPLKRKLEQGAAFWTQKFAPLRAIHSHLCDFNFVNGQLQRAVEGHKFCAHLNSDFSQCLIFEDNRPDARLIGIEYVISKELFDALPPEEQRLWHSKAYSAKAGVTIAPGLSPAVENPMMEDWGNKYGKTWYTWQVDKGDQLPLGQPLLMMAYTQDGQYPGDLLRKRDSKDWLVYRSKDRRLERFKLNIKKPSPHADSWQSGKTVQTTLTEIPA